MLLTQAPASAITFTITGVDSGQFNEFAPDSDTVGLGSLTFASPPNFESSTDADQDKTYEITITATDANGTQSSQDLLVNVTDINDDPSADINKSNALIDNITSEITILYKIPR